MPQTQIFSSLYLCNLIMVLTFDTFKLKLFDLTDWHINGFTTSGCKDIGIETSEFVTIELKSFLLCFFIQCYLQRMRLIQLSLIFNTISSDYLCLYWSNVCLSPTFVLARRLYQSDICTSLTFVPVRRLYQSDVSKSDVFTVRPL